jgi:hypothetical protein
VDGKVIGSAYALIFWIQNIGLWLFPLLIGKILDKTNPDVINKMDVSLEYIKANGLTDAGSLEGVEGALQVTDINILEKLNSNFVTLKDAVKEQAAILYDYKWPLIMLAGLGVAAFILGIVLKGVDKRKGLGLELPNIKK